MGRDARSRALHVPDLRPLEAASPTGERTEAIRMTLVITFVALILIVGCLGYQIGNREYLMRFLRVCFGTTGRKSSETPCAYRENKQ
jgi:hypothetical protein